MHQTDRATCISSGPSRSIGGSIHPGPSSLGVHYYCVLYCKMPGPEEGGWEGGGGVGGREVHGPHTVFLTVGKVPRWPLPTPLFLGWQRQQQQPGEQSKQQVQQLTSSRKNEHEQAGQTTRGNKESQVPASPGKPLAFSSTKITSHNIHYGSQITDTDADTDTDPSCPVLSCPVAVVLLYSACHSSVLFCSDLFLFCNSVQCLSFQPNLELIISQGAIPFPDSRFLTIDSCSLVITCSHSESTSSLDNQSRPGPKDLNTHTGIPAFILPIVHSSLLGVSQAKKNSNENTEAATHHHRTIPTPKETPFSNLALP